MTTWITGFVASPRYRAILWVRYSRVHFWKALLSGLKTKSLVFKEACHRKGCYPFEVQRTQDDIVQKHCLASIVASSVVLGNFLENIWSHLQDCNHISLWSSGSRLDFLPALKGSRPFSSWHPFGCWLGLGSAVIRLVLQVRFYPIPDSCCLWLQFIVERQFWNRAIHSFRNCTQNISIPT